MTDTVRSLENQALLDGAMKLAASRHRKRDHDTSTTPDDDGYHQHTIERGYHQHTIEREEQPG